MARYVNIASVEEANGMKKQLEAIVQAWISLKTGASNRASTKKKSSKKIPKKKSVKKKTARSR